MSTKIVVGVDGSEHSRRALKWCAMYAAALDGEIVVVHAIGMPVIVSPMTATFPVPEFAPQDREKVEGIVTGDWCAPLVNASLPFRVVLKDGDPAFCIMQVAETEKADLVVTGRRGRGGFAELLLGSTTHALSHHLNRPLLIVP
jgi:nucleotide-binding universal stress UspA family protein